MDTLHKKWKKTGLLPEINDLFLELEMARCFEEMSNSAQFDKELDEKLDDFIIFASYVIVVLITERWPEKIVVKEVFKQLKKFFLKSYQLAEDLKKYHNIDPKKEMASFYLEMRKQ